MEQLSDWVDASGTGIFPEWGLDALVWCAVSLCAGVGPYTELVGPVGRALRQSGPFRVEQVWRSRGCNSGFTGALTLTWCSGIICSAVIYCSHALVQLRRWDLLSIAGLRSWGVRGVPSVLGINGPVPSGYDVRDDGSPNCQERINSNRTGKYPQNSCSGPFERPPKGPGGRFWPQITLLGANVA